MRFVIATTNALYWLPQAECFADALRAGGHEAAVATIETIDHSIDHAPDVLFCIGTRESLEPLLEAVPAPLRMLYLIESVPTPAEADAFTMSKLQVHRKYLDRFDHVFVHTRRSIPMLRSLGIGGIEELIWPHFPSIYHPMAETAKDIDVLFVGDPSPHRAQIVRRAAERFKVSVANDVFHQRAARLYARARVALNIHFTPLRNFECRVIEALGCGAFLLTEALDPDSVLLDGKHLVVFDEHNLLDQLDHFLHDDADRQRIARTGHAEVQKYTVDRQTRRIVQVALEPGQSI